MAVCLVIKKSAVEHVRAQSKIAFFPQDTATFVDGVPSAIKDASKKAALVSMGAQGASSNNTMNTVLVDLGVGKLVGGRTSCRVVQRTRDHLHHP